MNLVAEPATPGRWLDTNWPCQPSVLAAVKAAGYVGLARYVPLPGVQSAGDITAGELQNICAEGLECLLVQHVRYPGWDPAKHDGGADANAAINAAVEAGYPGGGHIFLDLEGISGSAFATTAFAVDWCRLMATADLRAGVYVGYAVPLHPADLYDIPVADCYWSDAGPRQVATRGFAIKQGAEVTIAGVRFDTDTIIPDLLGGLPWVAKSAEPAA